MTTTTRVDQYAALFDQDKGLATTWVECKFDGNREAHDRLVITYSPLVRYVVSRMNITCLLYTSPSPRD